MERLCTTAGSEQAHGSGTARTLRRRLKTPGRLFGALPAGGVTTAFLLSSDPCRIAAYPSTQRPPPHSPPAAAARCGQRGPSIPYARGLRVALLLKRERDYDERLPRRRYGPICCWVRDGHSRVSNCSTQPRIRSCHADHHSPTYGAPVRVPTSRRTGARALRARSDGQRF